MNPIQYVITYFGTSGKTRKIVRKTAAGKNAAYWRLVNAHYCGVMVMAIWAVN